MSAVTRENGGRVGLRGQHGRPVPAERPRRGRPAAAETHRPPRQRHGADVGEVVPGVGEQTERAGDHTGHGLCRDDRDVEHDHDCEAPLARKPLERRRRGDHSASLPSGSDSLIEPARSTAATHSLDGGDHRQPVAVGEPIAVRPMHASVAIEAVQHHRHRQRAPARRPQSRTALIAPRPASATSTTWSARARATNVALSRVVGHRRTHAADGLDDPDLDAAGPRQFGERDRAARSARAPSRRAAIGGAIASGYQRCAGHTSPGPPRSRPRVASASVVTRVRRRTTAPACAPTRAGPSTEAARAAPPRPTSCRRRSRCRRRTTTRGAVECHAASPTSSQRGDEAIDHRVGVRRRQRDTQPARAGGHRRRPDGRHQHPAVEQRRGRGHGRRLVTRARSARSATDGRAGPVSMCAAAVPRARRLRSQRRSPAPPAPPPCRPAWARS